MLAIGIILIIVGAFTCTFGILQNTILHTLFADTGARLARFNDELDFHITWLLFGPGTVEIIVGIVLIVAGIVFIVRNSKKNKLSGQQEETKEEVN